MYEKSGGIRKRHRFLYQRTGYFTTLSVPCISE